MGNVRNVVGKHTSEFRDHKQSDRHTGSLCKVTLISSCHDRKGVGNSFQPACAISIDWKVSIPQRHNSPLIKVKTHIVQTVISHRRKYFHNLKQLIQGHDDTRNAFNLITAHLLLTDSDSVCAVVFPFLPPSFLASSHHRLLIWQSLRTVTSLTQ